MSNLSLWFSSVSNKFISCSPGSSSCISTDDLLSETSVNLSRGVMLYLWSSGRILFRTPWVFKEDYLGSSAVDRFLKAVTFSECLIIYGLFAGETLCIDFSLTDAFYFIWHSWLESICLFPSTLATAISSIYWCVFLFISHCCWFLYSWYIREFGEFHFLICCYFSWFGDMTASSLESIRFLIF